MERRAELLCRTGGTDSSTLVIFAGRLSREKHAQWVVPAVAAAADAGADVRLIVAGDGPLRPMLEEEARTRLAGRVAWLGHVSDRQTLATLIASADVFLHPNPREPFGIGPLEALASGTPVVLPRAGGVLSYADDSNAWLAEPTPDGLGRALYSALQQPDEARRRVVAALATARALDWPSVTARFLTTYADIHEARLARSAKDDRGSYSATGTPLMVSYR